MSRRYLLIGGALALIAAAFALSRCGNARASGFQAATVTRGPITQAVTATGTLNPVVNVKTDLERCTIHSIRNSMFDVGCSLFTSSARGGQSSTSNIEHGTSNTEP